MKPWPLLWRRKWWLVAFLLVAGASYWHWRQLPSPYESGELVMLTRPSPTTYYLNAEGKPAGFEYDLASEFAKRQGWRLRIRVEDSLGNLLRDTGRGLAHLAGAGLTVTPERARRLRFGPAYRQERELLICGNTVRLPDNLASLSGLRLEVVAGSSHVERLQELRQAYPALSWVPMRGFSTEDLMERAASGLSDCTVVDGSTYDVNWNFLPNLKQALELSNNRDIAWALPRNADSRLRQALQDFFREMRDSGRLARISERYFGHLRRLGEADVQGILEKRLSLLPGLRSHFWLAQEETGLDWRLLAALAYQESQWEALAVSPTGVRGIMMLTADTADRLGVNNRLDPVESILAGARYLVMLKEQLPARIIEPDRTWMALAAYNLGMGHLEDARRLAQKLGRNADVWSEVKDVLPNLAKSAYVGQLRLGYARGGEARTLAENVRLYYDILRRFESAYGLATPHPGRARAPAVQRSARNTSMPPMYGRRTSGMATQPSASW